ncbi:MAG TPA: nucleotidyltransferase family protein [Pyrinomonadaceae bacterium]|nr:nucleotidyltransferase family protein [Pyrinomonadaceae bacterium]
MTENSAKIGGLLLAAGGSRRMGSPKQLLEFKGKTLLRRAAEALVDAGCDPVIVVLGAETDRSKIEIDDLPVSVSINQDWENGMSSSIRVGLEKLLSIKPDNDAVMITLCDQPFVTSDKIALFTNEFEQSRSPIIAAKYDDVLGVPALFGKELFSGLMQIEGDKGARDLIRNYEGVKGIDLPEAAFDLDTRDEWDRAGASPPS